MIYVFYWTFMPIHLLEISSKAISLSSFLKSFILRSDFISIFGAFKDQHQRSANHIHVAGFQKQSLFSCSFKQFYIQPKASLAVYLFLLHSM
jgi:hypothetical protein